MSVVAWYGELESVYEEVFEWSCCYAIRVYGSDIARSTLRLPTAAPRMSASLLHQAAMIAPPATEMRRRVLARGGAAQNPAAEYSVRVTRTAPPACRPLRPARSKVCPACMPAPARFPVFEEVVVGMERAGGCCRLICAWHWRALPRRMIATRLHALPAAYQRTTRCGYSLSSVSTREWHLHPASLPGLYAQIECSPTVCAWPSALLSLLLPSKGRSEARSHACLQSLPWPTMRRDAR